MKTTIILMILFNFSNPIKSKVVWSGPFTVLSKILRHWLIKCRTYRGILPLFVMLKPKQMIDLTCLMIINKYIKPFQRK